MAQIQVTVVDPLDEQAFDVTLPDNAPMSQVLPQLLPKLNINQAGSFTLQHPASGAIFSQSDTLASKGVKQGDKLRVVQAPTAAMVSMLL